MSFSAVRRMGVLLPAALLALSAGCDGPQRQARQVATEHWNRARAQVKARLAADQFAAGNVAAAAGELNEATRLDPQNPALTPLRVRVLLAEGRINQATELLEQAKLEGPPQAELDYLLGVVRQQQQRWEEALDAFRRAAELDAEEINYVTAAAQVLLQLGRPQEALDLLTSKAATFNWRSAYQATIAECHEQLGGWAAAATAWRVVADTPDADAGTRERLAVALYRAGRYGDAIPVLLMLLNDGPPERTACLRPLLVECYLAEGRTAAARDQAQLAARAAPESPYVQRLLARALAAVGDYPAALRVAQRALTLSANDQTTLELLAALAWRVGNRELAESAARKLVERDGDNAVGRHVAQLVRGL